MKKFKKSVDNVTLLLYNKSNLRNRKDKKMYKNIIIRELEELINQTASEMNALAEKGNELQQKGEDTTEINIKFNRLFYAIQNCKDLIQEERRKNIDEKKSETF